MVHSISPTLSAKEAYTPGLPREFVAETFGIAIDDVAKLGSAENPLGASPKARAAIERAPLKLDIYPEWSSQILRTAIAQKYGFNPS